VASDALVTTNLSRQFGQRWALADLCLRVRPGEVFGFLGPNGAGKTTAIRCMLGLLTPTSGTVELLGESDRTRRLLGVGAMVETPAFHDFMTARENLHISAAYGGIAPGSIDDVLALVGLTDRGDERVSGYSLGMRQRLGLARAMLGAPRLLILDEPTNGMDPRGIGDVRDLIQKKKAEGVAVLMSSHLLAEVTQVCDTVGILSEGRLVHTGPVTPDLESIYLSVTRGGVH
jgi:ABC-2 type transport system ATP-binding protein